MRQYSSCDALATFPTLEARIIQIGGKWTLNKKFHPASVEAEAHGFERSTDIPNLPKNTAEGAATRLLEFIWCGKYYGGLFNRITDNNIGMLQEEHCQSIPQKKKKGPGQYARDDGLVAIPSGVRKRAIVSAHRHNTKTWKEIAVATRLEEHAHVRGLLADRIYDASDGDTLKRIRRFYKGHLFVTANSGEFGPHISNYLDSIDLPKKTEKNSFCQFPHLFLHH